MRKTIILFCLLFSASLFAGNKSSNVLLKVVDLSGNPIAGAKVALQGSQEVYYTDFDGAILLKKGKSEAKKLSISMISFEKLNFTLQPNEANELVLELKSK